MLTIFIVYFMVGILFVIMAIPLKAQRVPHRHWYGLSVSETIESKELWYKINKLAGEKLFNLGLRVVFVSIMFFVFPVFGAFIYSVGLALIVFFGAVYLRIQIF